MACEFELKLAATPEKLAEIRSLAFPGAASQSDWASLRLVSTYYDTPAYNLRELSIGVRIRQVGEQIIQTVKSSDKTIGEFRQRNEDQVVLTENKLDTSLITEPYLQILIEG